MIKFIQIENEYAAFGYDDHPRDKDYLRFVKSVLETNGIESVLFTSDSPHNTLDWGSLDGGKGISLYRNFGSIVKFLM